MTVARRIRTLVVDDDPRVALLVRRALEADAHAVDVAGSIRAAHEFLGGPDYDLAVLDVELPDGSGLELLRRIREGRGGTLVVMLTVRQRETEVVEGLDAGADDYLGKPFSLGELRARARALLRRPGRAPRPVLEFGEIRMDRGQRRVRAGPVELELTPREYDLLEHLLERSGQVSSRRDLLAQVWGLSFDPGTNVLDVHISHLRRKLREAGAGPVIRTRRGVGFLLSSS
jgi:two-component system, OmpR family, response regulator